MTDQPSHILNLIADPTIPLSKEVAEPLLSLSEFGLVVFGLAVAIGIIGEHVSEKRRDRWLPESVRPKSWNWPFIWLMLVVLGVFAEFACDGAIWDASASLQAIADRETEELRAANLKLEQQIQPRRLSADQQAALTAIFRKYADGSVMLLSYQADADGFALAAQIARAAQDAGLPINARNVGGIETVGGVFTGLFVEGTNAAFVKATEDFFENLKLAPGVPVGRPGIFNSIGGYGAPSPLKIFIGTKLLPANIP